MIPRGIIVDFTIDQDPGSFSSKNSRIEVHKGQCIQHLRHCVMRS